MELPYQWPSQAGPLGRTPRIASASGPGDTALVTTAVGCAELTVVAAMRSEDLSPPASHSVPALQERELNKGRWKPRP